MPSAAASLLVVRGNMLSLSGGNYRCAIGKGGFSANKREGDGCTPLGCFSLRECWYRPDLLKVPETQLPLRVIAKNDGWCDDPAHADYNRHVKLPFVASHEVLWREDGAYDLIIPLGYNDNPVVKGRGSAIFLHCAKPGFQPTEGCVALSREELLALLPLLSQNSMMEIQEA